MAQEQTRFSPAQILMAAEKAESDGRLDHALQFYRYIADQQASAPEASVARLALDRLVSGRSPSPEPRRSTPTHARPQPAEPHLNGFDTAPVHERSVAPAHYQGAGPSQHRSAPAAEHAVPEIQPTSSASARPPRSGTTYGQARMPVLIRLPTPKRGYRSGRVLAILMTVVGGTGLLVGLVLLVVTLIAPKELGRLGPEAAGLIGIGGSVGAILSGAMLLLLGQLARAIFDGANAVRELVSIERAVVRHNARASTSENE